MSNIAIFTIGCWVGVFVGIITIALFNKQEKQEQRCNKCAGQIPNWSALCYCTQPRGKNNE